MSGYQQKNSTIKGIHLRCMCILICSILIFPPGLLIAADSPPSDSRDKTKEGIKTFRINIQRLQEGIEAQKELFTEAVSKEKSLLEELEGIDKRLNEQIAKLKDLEKKRDAQQILIDQKEQELAGIRAEKEKVQRHLQRRINAYYKMGNIGLLNVTFSAQTLPELLRFHDSFQALIAYDQNVISIYRKSIGDLERVAKSLTLEKDVLNDFIDEAQKEQASIDATKEEKEILLHHIQTQSKLHQQAIAEMEKAATDLSSSLLALKSKEQASEQGFLQKKGHLPPPVLGTVITFFQEEATNPLGIAKKSAGIAIEAPDGTKVKAIFPGTVVFAGYLRGYGNTIIVHHGFQYYSITSRVEEILTDKGNTVEAGTVIAEMGETATLMEKGMYFEIRHGSESLDPMLWLDTRELQRRQGLLNQ
jgi:septal ring factor EnvC (AmiA/AmiB activator)